MIMKNHGFLSDPRVRIHSRKEVTVTYCEDYPCCGHTPSDPCARQWYDEPYAFDLSRNPHALCEHESGFCEVYD